MRLILRRTVWVVTLLWANSLFAITSINGSTGLIEMPSAAAIEYKKVNFGLDYDLGDDETGAENSYSYKVNLGTFENWELGIIGGTVPTEGVFVNAKYFLMSDNERFPMAIAAGLEKVGSKNDTSAYLVASKLFDGGFQGHFGFRATFEEELDAAAMFGAEFMVDERFSFLGDLTGENKVYILNLGMRYYFDTDMSLRFSVLDVGKSRSEDLLFTAGFSIEKFI